MSYLHVVCLWLLFSIILLVIASWSCISVLSILHCYLQLVLGDGAYALAAAKVYGPVGSSLKVYGPVGSPLCIRPGGLVPADFLLPTLPYTSSPRNPRYLASNPARAVLYRRGCPAVGGLAGRSPAPALTPGPVSPPQYFQQY